MNKLTLCALLASTVLGCGSTYSARSNNIWQEQPHSAMDDYVQSLSSTSFPKLSGNKNYIILIDAFDDVKQLSKLAGFSGRYGHIEVVRDETVYGCRPPQCGEMNLSELQHHFRGLPYEIREVDIIGDTSKSVSFFRNNFKGTKYDFFYNNCTDAVVKMYDASGDKTIRVPPVVVDQLYAINARLRNFMIENGIPKPKRQVVWFPDQFENLGKFVAKGIF